MGKLHFLSLNSRESHPARRLEQEENACWGRHPTTQLCSPLPRRGILGQYREFQTEPFLSYIPWYCFRISNEKADVNQCFIKKKNHYSDFHRILDTPPPCQWPPNSTCGSAQSRSVMNTRWYTLSLSPSSGQGGLRMVTRWSQFLSFSESRRGASSCHSCQSSEERMGDELMAWHIEGSTLALQRWSRLVAQRGESCWNPLDEKKWAFVGSLQNVRTHCKSDTDDSLELESTEPTSEVSSSFSS